jgi:hypothetical protein
MSVTGKRKRHDDGEALHRAIKAQQRAELLAAKGRKRTPEEWREEYEKAMAGKRPHSNQKKPQSNSEGRHPYTWKQLPFSFK